MQQLLHFLIVDRDRRRALAAWRGSRWLLPVISSSERIRAATLGTRWLTQRGVSGLLVGQWLGRVAANDHAMDWLLIVDAHSPREIPPIAGLEWRPLRDLRTSAGLVDYQQWALGTAIRDDLPSVGGPFGSMTWFEAVGAWIREVVGSPVHDAIVYKATAYEVAVGIQCGRRRVFFKGLPPGYPTEAAVTRTLSQIFPQSFAPTIALESRPDRSTWWLTEHCAGTTLAGSVTSERTLEVVAALARIQKDLADLRIDLPCDDIGVTAAARWAHALAHERIASQAAAVCHEAIDAAQQTIASADLPRSWVGLDLDAGNVLVAGDSVRFIDLDHSRIGAAPLALSTLFRRITRTHTIDTLRTWIKPVRGAYEKPWMPPLAIRECWDALAFASLLLECHLGLNQLLRKSDRGEVYGALDLGRSRAAWRLERAALEAHVDSPYGKR